jgi:lipopolysaccharide/colanic/teichoic acid biosynthesis glycosyltransferase
MLQRFFDILFSGLALLILAPIFIVVIVILRFTGEGEIFYVQPRVGEDGRLFNLIKFATMLKNSPNMGTQTVTVKNDSRVLPFGKILRKTKINELPQLINILIGDMSIIGPRPQAKRCFFAFPKNVQKSIVQVKPGLSGIGSIVFRDEETMLDNPAIDRLLFYDDIIAPYKGELERWYIKNRDIFTYFSLIFITIWVVLKPESKIYKRVFANLPETSNSELKRYI